MTVIDGYHTWVTHFDMPQCFHYRQKPYTKELNAAIQAENRAQIY